MSPKDQLEQRFSQRNLDFTHYLNVHLDQGFVFSTRDYFVMGRPVDRQGHTAHIRDPEYIFSHPDAWWLHGFAGNTAKAWSILPYELPYLGFERFDLDLRFYPMSTIRRLSTSAKPDEKPIALPNPIEWTDPAYYEAKPA